MGVAVIDEGRFGRGAKVNAGGRQPMTALRTQRYFNQPSRAEEYSTFSRLRATFLDAIPLPNMESSSKPGVTQLDLDLQTTGTILEDTFRAVVQNRTARRIKRLQQVVGQPTLQN
jgi:hypothetical protein